MALLAPGGRAGRAGKDLQGSHGGEVENPAATPIWVVVISGGSRPMFSKDLEYTIGQCYKHAREARAEYMTVEPLFLALLDTPQEEAVLQATGAAFHRLRGDMQARKSVEWGQRV